MFFGFVSNASDTECNGHTHNNIHFTAQVITHNVVLFVDLMVLLTLRLRFYLAMHLIRHITTKYHLNTSNTYRKRSSIDCGTPSRISDERSLEHEVEVAANPLFTIFHIKFTLKTLLRLKFIRYSLNQIRYGRHDV